MLLTLALIALLAGVLIAGSIRLLGDAPVTPEEIFWQAVTEARKTALQNETEIQLRFDAKEKAFILAGNGEAKSILVPVAGPDLQIEFLQPRQGGSTVLIGGELVESQTVPFVSFYPDGTCSPFRMQIRSAGPAHILSIDPWTCAPVLKADENAP